MRMRWLISLGLGALTGVAVADTPPPPPSKYSQRSPGGTITALIDPAADNIEFHRTNTGEILWRHPRWEGWMFVADDGQHFVTGFPGMNLIYGYEDDLVLFTFWRRNQKLREVKLKEFAPDKEMIRKNLLSLPLGHNRENRRRRPVGGAPGG